MLFELELLGGINRDDLEDKNLTENIKEELKEEKKQISENGSEECTPDVTPVEYTHWRDDLGILLTGQMRYVKDINGIIFLCSPL